jgi:Flp pilus assembly protein TadD
MNDLESAKKESTKTLELAPDFPPALNDLAWTYFKQKRYEEATTQFQKAVEASGRGSSSLGNLGYCFAMSGRRAEALGIVKELEERYANGDAVAMFLAGVYVGLSDKDKAFALLERDFQQHSGQLPSMTCWITLEDLRSNPRYADLVRRIGIQS